jgi:membrane protease YdiL (CAAX protease family)
MQMFCFANKELIHYLGVMMKEELYAALYLFVFTVLVWSIAWRQGYFRLPVGRPKLFEKKLTLLNLVTAFLIFFGIPMVVIPVLFVLGYWLVTGHFIEDFNTDTPGINVLQATLTVVATLALLLYTLLLAPSKKEQVLGKRFFKWDTFSRNALFGFFSWFLLIPLTFFTAQIVAVVVRTYFNPVQVDQVAVSVVKNSLKDPTLFTSIALSMSILVPVSEELLFRGFLQTWLRQHLRFNGALTITSVVFALCHYSPEQGVTNIELLTTLFVVSCFLGFVYEKRRSLWASIALHATFNAATITQLFLQQSV